MGKNLAPTIATIIVAILAIGVAIFAVYKTNKDKEPIVSQVVEEVYIPTEDEQNEIFEAAHKLVQNNFLVMRLYVTDGLLHKDEPYGNLPEDGVYTANSDIYKRLSDITSIVDATYSAPEAERIKTNLDGNGLTVYSDRVIDSDSEDAVDGKETVLGISADFEKTEYTKDYSNCPIVINPVNPETITLTIYLNGTKPATETEPTTALEDDMLTVNMLKINGEWRLEKLVY